MPPCLALIVLLITPSGNGSTPQDKFHTLLKCDSHVPPGRGMRRRQDTLDGLRLLAGLGTLWGPSG